MRHPFLAIAALSLSAAMSAPDVPGAGGVGGTAVLDAATGGTAVAGSVMVEILCATRTIES